MDEKALPADYYHNDYAMTKVFNEWQIKKFARQQAMILRICNTYGPEERGSYYRSVISKIVTGLLRGESVVCYRACARKFLYIQDFVDIVGDKFFPGETINIAGSELINIGYLMYLILDYMGSHYQDQVIYRDIEETNAPIKNVSTAKMERLFRAKAKTPFVEGLTTCLNALTANHT